MDVSTSCLTVQAYGNARMHRIVPSSGGQPLPGGRGQQRVRASDQGQSTPDPWMPARVSINAAACSKTGVLSYYP